MKKAPRGYLTMAQADERHAAARAQARIDVSMADLTRRAEAVGITIACRRGCAACCTYVVAAYTAEIPALVDAIEAKPRAERDAIIARLVAWCRAWALHSKGKAGVGHVAFAWQVKRIGCPMLDPQTFDCQVYATRPTACRSHHAALIPDVARVQAEHRYEGCGCEVGEAPQDCFTSPTAAAHRHHNTIWQVSHTAEDESVQTFAQELAAVGAEEMAAGVLPEMVLKDGSARYGWPNPPRVIPLTVLKTSTRG